MEENPDALSVSETPPGAVLEGFEIRVAELVGHGNNQARTRGSCMLLRSLERTMVGPPYRRVGRHLATDATGRRSAGHPHAVGAVPIQASTQGIRRCGRDERPFAPTGVLHPSPAHVIHIPPHRRTGGDGISLKGDNPGIEDVRRHLFGKLPEIFHKQHLDALLIDLLRIHPGCGGSGGERCCREHEQNDNAPKAGEVLLRHHLPKGTERDKLPWSFKW